MPPLPNPFTSLEQKILYFPERSFRGTPDHVNLKFEDIFPIASDGVQLHGWHMPGTSNVVWLIFHGNGGNIGVRLDQYNEINLRYDASIVAIDYRGYGRSDGTPSETGLYADARAAYDLAKTLHPDKKIVIFGRSIGGAVAAQLASTVQAQALVLEAAISSISAVVRERAPWSRFTPIPLIIRSKFETTKHVANGKTPTLIFHGDSDQIVSVSSAHRIFEAAVEPKQLTIIPGGDHNGLDLVDSDLYHSVLAEFLRKHGAL